MPTAWSPVEMQLTNARDMLNAHVTALLRTGGVQSVGIYALDGTEAVPSVGFHTINPSLREMLTVALGFEDLEAQSVQAQAASQTDVDE